MFNMDVKAVPNEVTRHDSDEGVRQGFLAPVNAFNPYPPHTQEHDEWDQGHRITVQYRQSRESN
jgi:hypothetical protein